MQNGNGFTGASITFKAKAIPEGVIFFSIIQETTGQIFLDRRQNESQPALVCLYKDADSMSDKWWFCLADCKMNPSPMSKAY